MWFRLGGSRTKSGRSCMKLNDLREWTVLISKPSTSALSDHVLFSYPAFSPITCSLTFQIDPRRITFARKIVHYHLFFVHFGPDSSKPTINLCPFCPQRPCPQSSDDEISIPSRRFVYLEVVMADGG